MFRSIIAAIAITMALAGSATADKYGDLRTKFIVASNAATAAGTAWENSLQEAEDAWWDLCDALAAYSEVPNQANANLLAAAQSAMLEAAANVALKFADFIFKEGIAWCKWCEWRAPNAQTSVPISGGAGGVVGGFRFWSDEGNVMGTMVLIELSGEDRLMVATKDFDFTGELEPDEQCGSAPVLLNGIVDFSDAGVSGETRQYVVEVHGPNGILMTTNQVSVTKP